MKLQLLGLVFAFLLLGGVAYYTYTVASQMSQRDTTLDEEVAQLQANIASLQNALDLALSQQGQDAQQLASQESALRTEKAALLLVESQLSKLSADLAVVRSGNITGLREVASRLQNISLSLQSLQRKASILPPAIFLRTFGTALASFVERGNRVRYLRLTASGPASGAEAAIGSHPFNASKAGSLIEWSAVANAVAADGNHWFWPMVLEDTPNGGNVLEFEDAGGVQEVAAVSNGIRSTLLVSWTPTDLHVFKIVVVTPGVEADFYIDGSLVARMTTGVPNVSFLLAGAEVKGSGSVAPGTAMLDTYGGLLGGI